MKARSQTTPAAVAAVSAVALIGSMFLDWYALNLPGSVGGREIKIPSYSAFDALQHADVYLVVAAALALLFAGMLLARVLSNSPAPGLALLAAGIAGLAIVVYRGTNRPGKLFFGAHVDYTLKFGWFVSLVFAALIVLGGLLAYLAGPRLQLEADEFEGDEEPGAEPRSQGAADAEGEARAPGEASRAGDGA